jgi:hypothetical protein
MLDIITDLLAFGINISFEREFNQFKITLSKDDKSEFVVLPFDHLNEFKVAKYVELMKEKLLKDNTLG